MTDGPRVENKMTATIIPQKDIHKEAQRSRCAFGSNGDLRRASTTEHQYDSLIYTVNRKSGPLRLTAHIFKTPLPFCMICLQQLMYAKAVQVGSAVLKMRAITRSRPAFFGPQ